MKKKKLSWGGYKASDFPMITLDCTKMAPLTELFKKSPKIQINSDFRSFEENKARAEFHQRNLSGNMFNYAMQSHAPEGMGEKEMLKAVDDWEKKYGPCVEQYTNSPNQARWSDPEKLCTAPNQHIWTTSAPNEIPQESLTFESLREAWDKLVESSRSYPYCKDWAFWPGTSQAFKDTFGKTILNIKIGRKKQMEEMAKRVVMWMVKENFINDDISALKLMKLESDLIKVLKNEEED